jgi:hypothetical protein
MRRNTADGGTATVENARVGLRERARRARALAARYHGDAASILIEIADDFDARAALLEPDPSGTP